MRGGVVAGGGEEEEKKGARIEGDGRKRWGKERWVNKRNKKDDPLKTSRIREGRTMGEPERRRDSLRGLEEVSESEAANDSQPEKRG